MALSEKLVGENAITEMVRKINATFAPLESPELTGEPTAPTAVTGTNTTQIATTAFVQQEIAAIAATYVPKGSKATVGDLPALSSVEVGWVYNIEQQGVTTADFVEGAGNIVPAGANVAVIETGGGVSYNEVTPAGTENPHDEGWYELDGSDYVLTDDATVDSSKTYYEKVTSPTGKKWDILAGVVDLDDYQTKVLETPIEIDGTESTTVEGALTRLNTQKLNESDVEFMTATEIDDLWT